MATDERDSSALRILIVDDNQEAALSLAMLLKKRHFVEVARDGAAGLHAAATFWPDVVLLDVGLPDLSSYEVAKRMRQRLGSSVALIAVTAWDWEVDKERATEAGFDQHLRKPVDLHLLAQILTELGIQKRLLTTPDTA